MKCIFFTFPKRTIFGPQAVGLTPHFKLVSEVLKMPWMSEWVQMRKYHFHLRVITMFLCCLWNPIVNSLRLKVMFWPCIKMSLNLVRPFWSDRGQILWQTFRCPFKYPSSSSVNRPWWVWVTGELLMRRRSHQRGRRGRAVWTKLHITAAQKGGKIFPSVFLSLISTFHPFLSSALLLLASFVTWIFQSH